MVLKLIQLAQGLLTFHVTGNAKSFRHMENVLLVEGQPVLHPVTEAVDHLFAVADKGVHHAAIVEAVVLLRQRQRHIEVVETDHRLDTAGEQIVNKAVVKRDTFVVELAVTLRADAAPGDLEAVAVHAQILHQIEIFPVAVVESVATFQSEMFSPASRMSYTDIPFPPSFHAPSVCMLDTELPHKVGWQ